MNIDNNNIDIYIKAYQMCGRSSGEYALLSQSLSTGIKVNMWNLICGPNW